MVRHLFKNLLHKDDGYKIYFSKRGKENRTAALKLALGIKAGDAIPRADVP